MIGETFSNYHIVIKLGGDWQSVCACARVVAASTKAEMGASRPGSSARHRCAGSKGAGSGVNHSGRCCCPSSASSPADRVYRNGVIFTADAGAERRGPRDSRRPDRVRGRRPGVAPFVGAATVSVDLQGRFLMPGLIDGHMHPLEAGAQLMKCGLDYASLTVAELQQRVQACLDHTASKEPDAWLEVVSWFQESMRPAGVKTTRATLDALKTKRPVIVRSSFGHTVLANTRALHSPRSPRARQTRWAARSGGTRADSRRDCWKTRRIEVFGSLVPKPTAEEDVAAARAALKAMNRQGVTSFLDAVARPEDMAAFAAVRRAGA